MAQGWFRNPNPIMICVWGDIEKPLKINLQNGETSKLQFSLFMGMFG
ncbi:hypothetical protein HanPI659440_Chr15g0577391 [Helianthus annuus]|nr:hypothetical protein HanPI659440_Chr15g0577391 [Helianthus annuus]